MRYMFGLLGVSLLLLVAACDIDPDALGNNTIRNNDSIFDDNETTEGVPGQEDLQAIFDEWEDVDFSVTYQVNDGNQTSGEITQTRMGMNRTRVDAQVDGTMVRMLFIDDEMFTCVQQGSRWDCFTGAVNSPFLQARIPDDVRNNIDDYRVSRLQNRAIAGVTAQCYRVTSTADAARTVDARYCFSPEGVPLIVESQNVRLVATSYSIDVIETSFALPGRVVGDLEDFGIQTYDPNQDATTGQGTGQQSERDISAVTNGNNLSNGNNQSAVADTTAGQNDEVIVTDESRRTAVDVEDNQNSIYG